MDKTTPKRGRGKLPGLTPEQKNSVRKAFQEYINITEIPIIAEFAYQVSCMDLGLADSRVYLYDHFPTLIKMAIQKKESALEKKSLDGDVNTTQAIFSLKQLGWRDRQEVAHSGTMNYTLSENFTPDLPDGEDG